MSNTLNPTGYANITTGQQQCTAAAVQLPNAPGSIIVLTALKANGHSLYVGGPGVATGTGIEIAAGNSVVLPVANLNMLYLIGTSGDYVSWAVMY